MEVNWFTVLAQIVNFLVLVWLLKRFLYKPVLDAIDNRERKIAAKLDAAETAKAEAEKEHVQLQQKNLVFDQERAEKMNAVVEEINTEKERLLEEVRSESNILRAKYEESLKRHDADMAEIIKRKATNEVFAIAGKTLADLANVELDERAVDVFIEVIRQLDDVNKAKFKKALIHNEKAVVIKSAFELSPSSRSKLESLMEEISGHQNKFRYEVKTDLVSGIEIDTRTYQVSWNIEAYLDSLKNSITPNEPGNESE